MNELTPGQTARTLQIIVGTMAAGVAALLVVAAFVESDATPEGPILSYGTAGGGVMTMYLSFLVPRLTTRSMIGRMASEDPACESEAARTPQSEELRLCGVLCTVTIIGVAMLEGGALFAGLTYMMTGELLALATAIALIALLITRIPTRMRVDGWIAEQSRSLAAKRPSQTLAG